MRKIIAIVIIIALAIALTGCFSSEDIEEMREELKEELQEQTDEASAEDKSEPDEDTEEKPESEPEPAPEIEPEVAQPETVVYEDDSITMTFLEWNEDGVLFDVNNKTEKTLTLQCNVLMINGQSFSDILMSDPVAPNSVGTVKAGMRLDLDNYDVATLGGQFDVIDFDSEDWDSFMVNFNDVVINDKDSINQFDHDLLVLYPLLYHGDDVDVYFWQISEDGDILFMIDNRSDIVWTFQSDALSINGRSYSDFVMSDPVGPHAVGFIVAQHAECETLTDDVESISGKLTAIDFASDDWDDFTIKIDVDDIEQAKQDSVDLSLQYDEETEEEKSEAA